MSAFSKLKAIREQLSANEQKLADFVLASANALRDLSSQELASVVGVSQSSVVKFAQKLGFKGYPALKLAVIDDLSKQYPNKKVHGSIKLSDSYEQMADKLVASKVDVLQQTKALNEVVAFEQAVEHLRSSKRVLLAGVGGSALVAKDFAYKLQKLGIVAIAESDAHAQLAMAATLAPQDLVFAISESGMTREVVNVVNAAADNQAQIISLTKFGPNQVADKAGVRLYSVGEEVSTRISSILARTAQELVIDMLFIALTQSSDIGRAHLEQTKQVVARFRSS